MAIDVAKRCWVAALALVLSLSGINAGERWSRQLTDYGNMQGSDWIPLSRPGDRQAGAKVLNYFDNTGFLGNDNSAQPQHHQFSYVNQPFGAQASRVVFPPPPVAQPLQQELEPAFNQPFGSHQSFIQHPPFGGVQTIQRHPLPAFNPQLPKENLVQEKPSLVEHQFQFPSQVQQQTTHLRQPPSAVHQGQPANGVSQEEVQLLYVPVETLYNQKQAAENTRFNSLPQPVSASLINDFYTAATTTAKPRTTNTPFTTKVAPSAALPSKPKPNQPPLAMFMYNDDKQAKLTVSDALSNLKNVNNIAVLDSLSKNLPKVFIGPSGLAPPKGYSKFELPYLSSIDQNRLSAKSGDLPFFVAPQSYKTPGGFSKIPLPAPHVGSVIVQQPLIQSNYFRQPENIEYYQPSTLKFTDSTTKSPITLPASKPQYESDHYTSPTSKPTTDRTNYSRGNTQTPQESYRQPQTERALFSHSPFNSVNTNRHIVNEEYFNLAKTKKPTTPSPTQSYSPKTYKPFDFKPIPEQKIPLYPEANDFTTQRTTTTTERPHTSRQEENRMKSFFKEENFRNRRPYTQSTVSTPYEEQEVTQPIRSSHENEGQFVHKFKLVDSVRPQTTPATKSVIDNAFLDFFQQDNHDTLKTIVSNQPASGAQQVIRNNYFSQNSNDEPPKQKFVSTYYAPTTTSTTLGTTTPAGSSTAQDSFFKEFDEKSKQYEPEVTRFPQSRLQNQESFLNRFTETTYTNKYKYETNTDDAHYPVEVVTTQEPIRQDSSNDVTIPPSEQSYSIPSELPPISANLPGLVNSLMEDEWPHKKGEQDSSPPATTKGHFRKQIYRTTEPTTTLEPYTSEITTRRTRGRRPTTSSSSNYDSATPTRATTVNRSRSRYVAADGERSSGRTRTRSRPQSSSSRNAKEEENLEYQRDVLKQNYPVIRPTSGGVTTTTTTPAPPPPTTSTTTTHATTMPVTYQQIYEEQTERFNPYYSSPEPQNYSEEPVKYEEVSIPKKDSYTENYYEPEITTTLPHTTYKQQYSPEPTTEEIDDESVRVLPVDHPVEQKREQPVEIQREKPATAIHAQLPRRQPARQPVYQLPEEQHPSVTSSYNSHEDEMEIRKVEITPRPRRPLSRQPVYSPRTTAHTERPTTERTTTELPPSASSSRGSSVQRRPAFVRRPARPLYTTTPAPTTTYSSRGVSTTGDDEQPTQGSYTVRPKSRQDVLRGRTRRPVTTSAATTTTASPEPPVTRGFARNKDLRRVSPTSRSRQELRERERDQREQPTETTTTQPPRFRIRERTRFNLQPQESQWSTKLTQNSFQPVQDVESRGKNYEGERTATEPEIEIVTASALQQNEEDVQLISVSANMAGGPTAPAVRERDQRNDKHGNDVLLKEVELSQEPPQAEENEENSNSPSFAELLNDVMKEYMDSNLQQGETDKKPVENEVLLEEPKPVTSKSQRGSSERNPYNARANFRKRGRSHVVEAFEAAESQHINSHVYNTAGFESLKTIDKAALQGKNVNEAKGSRVVEEVTTTTTTTTTEAPVTDLPETTTFGAQDTTPLYETTSILPTEREVTTAVPTLEAQSENDEHQFSTEQFYDDEQDQVDDEPEDHQQGIFDDVKKQLSDLFAMAENDPETEEIEDEEEQYRPLAMGSYHDVEQGSTENPITSTAISSDAAASENRQEPVTELAAKSANDDAMGPMAIPTSTSNGITHETEICYRGRCIKTDEKKPKKSKFKSN